jgi:hypothetical protein
MFSSPQPSTTLLELLRHRRGNDFPRAKRVWDLREPEQAASL